MPVILIHERSSQAGKVFFWTNPISSFLQYSFLCHKGDTNDIRVFSHLGNYKLQPDGINSNASPQKYSFSS